MVQNEREVEKSLSMQGYDEPIAHYILEYRKQIGDIAISRH
jgi:hypothetical protein